MLMTKAGMAILHGMPKNLKATSGKLASRDPSNIMYVEAKGVTKSDMPSDLIVMIAPDGETRGLEFRLSWSGDMGRKVDEKVLVAYDESVEAGVRQVLQFLG